MLVVWMDGVEMTGTYDDRLSGTDVITLRNVVLESGRAAELVLVPRERVRYCVTDRKELGV